MRTMMIVSLLAAGLALTACDKQKAADVGDDAQAAAAKVGEETKDLANSAEIKEVGNEIKDAAKDAGAMAKDAAGEAKQAIHEATAPDGEKPADAPK